MNILGTFYGADGMRVREEIEAALQKIGEKHGIEVLTKYQHGGNSLSVVANLRLLDENGHAALDPAFKRALDAYGLDHTKTGVHNGASFKLVGYRPSRPKYPWDAERSDGRLFKMPTSMVQTMFRRDATSAAAIRSKPRADAGGYEGMF